MRHKLIITFIIAVIATIYTVDKSIHATTVDEWIQNAEAIYTDPEGPEKPKPEAHRCFTEFLLNKETYPIQYRVCGSDPVDGGGPSRIGATKCIEVYAYYQPVETSEEVCYKQAGPQ